MNLFIKMYGIKEKLSKVSFKRNCEFYFFIFLKLFCIYRVVSLTDFSAGFFNRKIDNQKKSDNILLYCKEITELDKLIW